MTKPIHGGSEKLWGNSRSYHFKDFSWLDTFALPWILNAWNLAWFTWVTFSNKVETPLIFLPKKGLTKQIFCGIFNLYRLVELWSFQTQKFYQSDKLKRSNWTWGRFLESHVPKLWVVFFVTKKVCQTFFSYLQCFFFTHGFFQFLQLRCLHDLRWQNGKMAVVTCAGPWAWRGDRFHAYLPQGGRVFLLGTFFLGRIEEHGGVLDNDVKLVGWSLLRSVVDIGVSRYNFLILYN